MINWLERRFEKFAISNLTVYLIIVIAAVSGYSIFMKLPYVPLTPELLLTSQWWQIVIFPFRIDESFLWLAITLYMLWFFGTSLEADMGAFRYNLFILIGIVASTVAVVFLPFYVAPPWRGYVYVSVFLAVAYRAPDTEILIFFILPVKIKYLAWLALGLMLVSAITMTGQTGTLWPFVSPVVSLLNLVVFYGSEIYRNVILRGKTASNRARFQGASVTIHRCHVCGITEHDDPRMDFRFCADCSDHEYCRDHLADHPHIRD